MPQRALTLFVAILFASAAAAQSSKKALDESAHIRNIEKAAASVPASGTEPAVTLSIDELLAKFKVPGLSIAVIENFQVVWAKGYGITEPGSKTPVTTKTLFQAGSISKPVAATGALSLVQKGTLQLDTNVNDQLKSWKVPDNEFTVKEKVTLRRLMSHSGGLTVHGFPGYDVDEPIPTVVQALNGEKPANTDPVRVDFVPGTKFRYSGGGITIEQLLMTDVTGKPFPQLLRETVLDKIGMGDSSYEQPLPAARAANTAGGARGNGDLIHGRWHIYPEMAAAGLWTTPSDLAHFAIEIAQSRNGKSNKILTQQTATEMLTPVIEQSGLGFFMEERNPGQFGHNGADEGFQAILTMNYNTGSGVVLMMDSDNGILMASNIVRAVAKEYAWKDYKSGDPAFTDMVLLGVTRGVPALLARYDQQKKNVTSGPDKVEESTLNGLGYIMFGMGDAKSAVAIFERNVQEYPQSSNVYDSLADAQAKAGDKAFAIKNYEKSLELNPKNGHAITELKKLKSP